jgi:NAD(P)-dependent dehydrogenase (short-subunit alcohol dehydrogenase family)
MSLSRRIALVTGATSGIGFHTASALARGGYLLYVTGRDAQRGRAAEQRLRDLARHNDIYFVRADASTVAGNQELARQILATRRGLDVLVNNVGGAYNDRQLTADGYEASLAMNFVGPVALTQALLPMLHRSADARIVNVASAAYAMWKGDAFSDLHSSRRYLGSDAYARAKLLNIWWTFALARRLEGTGVVANAVNPGTAWTAMTQATAPRSFPLWLRALWPLLRAVQRRGTPESAARSSIFAAAATEPARLNGAYIEKDGRPCRPSNVLTDSASQERAWELGLSLIGHSAAPGALAPIAAMHQRYFAVGGAS